MGLLGPTPGALRVVAALLGILTIPATYLLGRTLFGTRAGLRAAFLAATTVWTVNLSRVALRAVAAPPLAALALALLWQGLAERRRVLMAWAGLAYGLLFYTYLAARFTPVALGLFLIYLAIWHRERLWLRGLLIFGLVAALVAAPLGAYLLVHGEAFGRAGQVSVFNPAIGGANPWRTLAAQALRTAGGFFWRGDFIPRHNVPLRPVFDPLTAAALLGGVILAGVRWRRSPAHALVLIWVVVMLLPTVLAEDAPHLLRARECCRCSFCCRRWGSGRPTTGCRPAGPAPWRRSAWARCSSSARYRAAGPTPGTCTARRPTTTLRRGPPPWPPT